MSAEVLTGRYEETRPKHPVNIPTPLDQYNEGYSEDDVTAKEDRMEAAITAMAQAIALQAQTATPKNGKNWPVVLAAVATVGMFLVTVSGVRWMPQGEANLMLNQQHLERLQKDNDKLELRLREYEVWLQTTRERLSDGGWKLPPLPKGTKE